MNLNFETYKDKVNACWIGKNIGGTMGTPYEGRREMQDIQGFVTKPGEVLPNDDLDLQLVWLRALEQSGPYAITAELLGEYWLSFITPHWNEYGLAKNNLSKGLQAPLSGDYDNDWKNSNGAWIRTEIWACVTPGAPEIASRYAMEDAKVDHGAGEGTYAAAFVAALQSAAFVLNDIQACIEVGLSVIPEDCRVAKSVRHVRNCFDQNKSPIETRNEILEMNADIGDGWFEAPSNVAYAVLGLLFGKGDFKKAMILAINCGDDTDCTGATVGATMGILGGSAAIPVDWKEYIGDSIVTISIARGNNARSLPDNCHDLTERVCRLAAATLLANHVDVSFTDSESEEEPAEISKIMTGNIAENKKLRNTLRYLKPNTLHFECVLFDVYVCLTSSANVQPLSECRIRLDFINKYRQHENAPYSLFLRWILPEGFTVKTGCNTLRVPQVNSHSTPDYGIDVVIGTGENVQPVNRLILEVVIHGRPTVMYIPILLLG